MKRMVHLSIWYDAITQFVHLWGPFCTFSDRTFTNRRATLHPYLKALLSMSYIVIFFIIKTGRSCFYWTLQIYGFNRKDASTRIAAHDRISNRNYCFSIRLLALISRNVVAEDCCQKWIDQGTLVTVLCYKQFTSIVWVSQVKPGRYYHPFPIALAFCLGFFLIWQL